MAEYYGHLPKFPEPAITSSQTDSVMRVTTVHSFSHDQMDEYGQACYEAGLRTRQAPAPVEVSRLAEEAKARAKNAARLPRDPIPRQMQLDACFAAIDSLASMASTPVGEVSRLAEEPYGEIKATLEGLHSLMESLCSPEIYRRLGPAASHARGYTHKITAALRHLDRLATAAPTPVGEVPAGWKLVQIEPSAAMLAQAMKDCGSIGCGSCGEHTGIDYDDLRAVWASMLTATPTEEASK